LAPRIWISHVPNFSLRPGNRALEQVIKAKMFGTTEV